METSVSPTAEAMLFNAEMQTFGGDSCAADDHLEKTEQVQQRPRPCESGVWRTRQRDALSRVSVDHTGNEFPEKFKPEREPEHEPEQAGTDHAVLQAARGAHLAASIEKSRCSISS